MFYDNQKIVIELDGRHHYDDKGVLRSQDRRRDDWLEAQGYKILRYPSNQSIADLFSQTLYPELQMLFSSKPDCSEAIDKEKDIHGFGHATSFFKTTTEKDFVLKADDATPNIPQG